MPRIDHINIVANDLEAMRDFLVNLLGVTEGERPAFSFPGYWLYDGEEPIIHLNPPRPGTPGVGFVDHIAFGPCDFDEHLARVEALGVEHHIAGIPGTGIRQIFVSGPEGAKIELRCPE